MKSWALLSSNLPSVIDLSNLSMSREAKINLIGRWQEVNYYRQWCTAFHFRFSEKKTDTTGWMGNWALLVNNAQFMSVDLIGEKNQVILELLIIASIYWLYTLQKQYIFIHQALLDLIDRKKKGLIQDDRDDRSYIDKEIVYENTAFGMFKLEMHVCSVYICSWVNKSQYI